MRHSIALDILQHFQGVEGRHDHVRRSQRKHGKSHNAGSVRKRRGAEANRRDVFATQTKVGGFNHRSPGEACDHDTLCWASGSSRGHEAREAIEIPVGIAPVRFSRIGVPAHESFERRVAIHRGIQTDEVLQRRNLRFDLAHLLAKAAVIKEPGSRRVVQKLNVRVQCIPEIDGDPHCAGAHDPRHA